MFAKTFKSSTFTNGTEKEYPLKVPPEPDIKYDPFFVPDRKVSFI